MPLELIVFIKKKEKKKRKIKKLKCSNSYVPIQKMSQGTEIPPK